MRDCGGRERGKGRKEEGGAAKTVNGVRGSEEEGKKRLGYNNEIDEDFNCSDEDS